MRGATVPGADRKDEGAMRPWISGWRAPAWPVLAYGHGLRRGRRSRSRIGQFGGHRRARGGAPAPTRRPAPAWPRRRHAAARGRAAAPAAPRGRGEPPRRRRRPQLRPPRRRTLRRRRLRGIRPRPRCWRWPPGSQTAPAQRRRRRGAGQGAAAPGGPPAPPGGMSGRWETRGRCSRLCGRWQSDGANGPNAAEPGARRAGGCAIRRGYAEQMARMQGGGNQQAAQMAQMQQSMKNRAGDTAGANRPGWTGRSGQAGHHGARHGRPRHGNGRRRHR